MKIYKEPKHATSLLLTYLVIAKNDDQKLVDAAGKTTPSRSSD